MASRPGKAVERRSATLRPVLEWKKGPGVQVSPGFLQVSAVFFFSHLFCPRFFLQVASHDQLEGVIHNRGHGYRFSPSTHRWSVPVHESLQRFATVWAFCSDCPTKYLKLSTAWGAWECLTLMRSTLDLHQDPQLCEPVSL